MKKKATLLLPRKETCSLGGGGEDHEPPIGTGGSSFFFNIPDEISLKTPIFSGGYFNFAIKKEKNPNRKYTAIFSVNVITEEKGSRGRVIFDVYKMAEGQHAKLLLWLDDEFKGTPTRPPDVIVDGDSEGAIRTNKKFTFKDIKNNRRKLRAIHSTDNLRIIKWEIVDDQGNTISDSSGSFTAEGDDSYNFYVSFYHT